MSARKRRAARKIAQMVRMDQTRMRMPHSTFFSLLSGRDKRIRFVEGCMVPLGKKLARMGLRDRAIAALKASGSDIQDSA